MNELTLELLAELRAVTEKATPGPWEWEAPAYSGQECYVRGPGRCIAEIDCGDSHQVADDNAAFIAAANPQTVLTLLSDLKAKDARIAELERALGPFAQARLVSWGKRADEDNWFHVRVKLPCDPNGAVTRACKTLESNNG